jgi:hypothetical protein
MGSCIAKITITEDMFLTLKSAPNDKLLLSLCLHYDIYDQESQKKIDELCQLSLTTDKGLDVFLGNSADNEVAALRKSAEKNNLSIE